MNPTPVSAPFPVRLVCRAARLWCALSDATTSPHVAGCAACQRHLADVSALSSALRAEASATLTGLDPASAQRTCQAVRQAHAVATRTNAAAPRRRPNFALLAGLTAVAGLAMIALVIQPERDPVDSLAPVQVASRQSPPVVPEAVLLVEAMQTWSQKWSESVVPSAGKLAANNPLQTEMSSVYADARAALDFLALNFLPVMPSSAEPEPIRKSTG
jgi:hypothetical protein